MGWAWDSVRRIMEEPGSYAMVMFDDGGRPVHTPDEPSTAPLLTEVAGGVAGQRLRRRHQHIRQRKAVDLLGVDRAYF